MPFENNFFNLIFLISAIGSMLIVFGKPIRNKDKYVDENPNLTFSPSNSPNRKSRINSLLEEKKTVSVNSGTDTRKSVLEQTLEINMILDTIHQNNSQPAKSIYCDPHHSHDHNQTINFGSTLTSTSHSNSYSSHDSSSHSSSSSSYDSGSTSSDGGSGGSSCD